MAQILNFKGDYKGLTAAEAEDRLRMYGLNDDRFTDEPPYSLKRAVLCPRFFVQAAAVLLLFAAGQLVMGVVMLFLTVMLTAGDVIWQLRLYEKESAMKRLSGMKFRVVRDGELTLVRKEYLVPDDILVLQGGERVPADAHLLETEELTVDESVFDGFDLPSEKKAGADSSKKLPKSTCVYKNTVVLTGTLIARIFATGEDVAVKREESRLESFFERAIRKTSLTVSLAGLFAALLTALLCYLGAGELGGYTDVLTRIAVPALSVGMCFIPAQADKLVRLFYLNGAARLNRRHAMVKNISTVEELSAITCVCVEKTGTITKNHIEVADVFTENQRFFTNVCVLACEPVPASPAEKAILLYATFGGADVKDLFSNRRIATYPFSENTKMAGNLWEINGQRLMCIKGSPEEVLALCTTDPNELHYIQQKRQSFTKLGRQVMAVAFAALAPEDKEPEKLSALRYEYIGLIALENTTRDTVPYAVKSCIKSGVRVIMLTGDNEETAAAIGRQIGLQSVQTITGAELERDGNVMSRLSDVGIFARVTPEQRMRVVQMLRESGEIVAMVGTGSDDIAVLEEADVGISVNNSSTPAAAESCDMLMSDDNFLAVADAVKESRQIHRNVKGALGLMLSAHTALALFAVTAVATGGAMLFTPVLAVLLTCVLFPLAASMLMGNTSDMKADFISSGFVGRGVMNSSFLPKTLIMGGSLALAVILFYLFTLTLEIPVKRSILLMMMTVGVILEGFTLASQRRTFFAAVKEKHGFSGMLQVGLLLLFSLVTVFVPYLNTAFGFGMPNVLVLVIAVVITVLFTFWPEIAKKFNSLR